MRLVIILCVAPCTVHASSYFSTSQPYLSPSQHMALSKQLFSYGASWLEALDLCVAPTLTESGSKRHTMHQLLVYL